MTKEEVRLSKLGIFRLERREDKWGCDLGEGPVLFQLRMKARNMLKL